MSADRKPTILMFVGQYLPGWKAGGILRSVENVVNHLHDEFNFRIVTRDRDLGDESPYADVTPLEWQPVGNALVYYLPPGRQSLAALRAVVRKTPHDLIHLNSFFEPLTVKVLAGRRLSRAPYRPIILSPCGEFAWASLRQKYPKKLPFMWLARIAGIYQSVTWRASSAYEADDIKRVMKVADTAIKVAIDLPTIWADGTGSASGAPHQEAYNGLRVSFLARIAREKNLDVALRILKQVRSRVAFDIIGPIENAGYWSKCLRIIEELPSNITARYLGPVRPTDVIDTLSRYDLFLFPTGGENCGHVIAESLTAGTPVLVSANTPWRNLEAQGVGWDLPLDDLAPFVRVIDDLGSLDVRSRQDRRRAIKESARRLVADPSAIERSRRLYYDALAEPRLERVSE
jgi:glycosyltransferase involved in cell wall biosynthesis